MVQHAGAGQRDARRHRDERRAHDHRHGRRPVHAGPPAPDDRPRPARRTAGAGGGRPDDGGPARRRRARLRLDAGSRCPGSSTCSAARARRRRAIVHVCGTSADPQDRADVIAQLRAGGALVAETNAEAAVVGRVRRDRARRARGSGRMTDLFTQRAQRRQRRAAQLRRQHPRGRRQRRPARLAAAGRRRRGRRHAARPAARRSAHRGGQRHRARRATWRRSPCSSTSCSPARRSRRSTASGASCTRARRSRGRTCAGRCRARSPARSPTRAGPPRRTRAAALAARGEIALEPCHHHGAVGPMAGIISPSMPVWVVENAAAGNRAYCNFNEGLGKVLRFGANRADVLDRLRWMGTELFERAAGRRCARLGGVELRPIMAQALHMGDEVHNRNAAATGLLVQAARPGPADRRSPGRRRAPRDRVRRRQRPLLPEPLDGGLQGDARRGARRRAQHDGHRDGPQRRELRHPPERDRRRAGSRRPPTRSTACSSPATASRTPPPTSATARSPRPPASAGSRWPRRPRSCSSSAARRPTRPRTAGACGRSRSGRIPPSRCRR